MNVILPPWRMYCHKRICLSWSRASNSLQRTIAPSHPSTNTIRIIKGNDVRCITKYKHAVKMIPIKRYVNAIGLFIVISPNLVSGSKRRLRVRNSLLNFKQLHLSSTSAVFPSLNPLTRTTSSHFYALSFYSLFYTSRRWL